MKITRPLSPDDLKVLNYELKQIEKNFGEDMKLSVGIFIAFIVIGLLLYFWNNKNQEILWGLGLYLIVPIWSGIESFVKKRKGLIRIEQIKKNNQIESISVKSSAHLRFKEDRDFGVYYIFQLESGKLIALGGQDFYPTKRFPSNHFEIVQCFDEKGMLVFFHMYDYGKKAKPTNVVAAKYQWEIFEHPMCPNPYTFEIVDGDIHQIYALIEQWIKRDNIKDSSQTLPINRNLPKAQ